MSARGLYVGRGGQMVVMAEFLVRGYNVAVPEVDRGDDIFVVQDDNGTLSRVQVKTGNLRELTGATPRTEGQFKVSLKQLKTLRIPDITYVLVARSERGWGDFLVVSRDALYDAHLAKGIGSPVDEGRSLLFKIEYSDSRIACSGVDLQAWRNAWTRWPILDP